MSQGKDTSSSYAETFQQALSLQQSNKLDEALAVYLKLLDKSLSELSPEQASVLNYNIAVIYHQQQKHELGYVFNEKALVLNESNTSAKSLKNEIVKIFKPNEAEKEVSALAQINNSALKYVPLELLGVFSLVFLLIFLRQFFNFLIQRKTADIENKDLPRFPIKTYIIAGLFVISTLFLFMKFIYSQQIRGITKVATVVQVAPGENQATIIEIPIASTMNILQTRLVDGMEYVQIKVPGSYSGWIKKQDIELLNSLRWP